MGDMEKLLTKTGIDRAGTGRKLNSLLLVSVSLLFVLPLLSITGEIIFEHESFTWMLIGKWFVFWTTGIRLFTAGISQSSNPAFTARIFKMKTQESYIVIRELGFANISLGVMGILSVINDHWRILAAIAGSLFFGLAGIQHLFKKSDSNQEMIAMTGDLFVFIILLSYLTSTIFSN
jgi:hypothetical protein